MNVKLPNLGSKLKIDYDAQKQSFSIVARKLGRTKFQRLRIESFLKDGNLAGLMEYLATFAGSPKHIGFPIRKAMAKSNDVLKAKKPGQWAKRFESLKDMYQVHAPLTDTFNDWIGIEIECKVPYATLQVAVEGETVSTRCDSCDGDGVHYEYDDEGEIIEGSDVECMDCSGEGTVSRDNSEDAEINNSSRGHQALAKYFESKGITRTCIKSDGSIRTNGNDEFAVEVVILSRMSDPENLRKVCKALRKLKTRVNGSCGLHIHFNMKHYTKGLSALGARDVVKSRAKQVEYALPILMELVPPSRRENSYCKPQMSRDFESDRYCAVNLCSYPKYGTVEIRLHSGTTDFNKIYNWARLIDLIMRGEDLNLNKKVTDLDTLVEKVGIPEDLLEYMAQRMAHLRGEPSTLGAVDQDDQNTRVDVGALRNPETLDPATLIAVPSPTTGIVRVLPVEPMPTPIELALQGAVEQAQVAMIADRTPNYRSDVGYNLNNDDDDGEFTDAEIRRNT